MNKNVKFEVVTKRDVAMMKAFITFVNRVKHPRVSFNFVLFGLLIIFMPFTANTKLIFAVMCYVIGGFMVLMGLFRHYIPLMAAKTKDTDYLEGVEYAYRFGKTDITVYRDGETYMLVGSYQNVTSFFSDEYYYYLGVKNEDLFVLPKNRFTVGDAADFEMFITEKSNEQCRFVPVTVKNKLIRAKNNIVSNVKGMNATFEEKFEQQKRK